MRTRKIIVKEVFKSTNQMEFEKVMIDNIIKLIIRHQKLKAKETYTISNQK